MFFQDCFFHLPSNRFSFVIASLIKYHNLDMIWPKRIESDWCGNWNSVHVTGELFSLQEHMLWVHVELVVNYHVLIILKSLSHVQLFATPWTAACQASLSSINSLSLLKLMSIELVRLSNHLILCCPLPLPPSIFPSIRVFSNESVLCIRWPKYSASASVLPMNIQNWFPFGLTGWISLQSKGLKSLLQHHSSRASILWCSAFFIVWLSHPYMTPRKTIALTRWIFVGKVPIGWLLLLVTYFQI